MERNDIIKINYNLKPYKFAEQRNEILEQCKNTLLNTIHDGVYVSRISNIKIISQNKINNDGSINICCQCKCTIIDPEIHKTYLIYINTINKIGYYHQNDKVCIFIPANNKLNISIKDTIKVKIIGKRIEDTILCIAEVV